MARYERSTPAGHDVWQITRRGTAVTVRSGPREGERKERTRTFDSTDQARAFRDRSVKARLRKGFVPMKAARRGAHDGISQACTAIEAFGDDAIERRSEWATLDIGWRMLPAQSQTQLDRLERELDFALPDDLRAFWVRGLRYATGCIEEPEFASFGFEWLAPEAAVRHTRLLREVGADLASDPRGHGDVIRSGVALTAEEPELVLTPAGLFHFSFRNSLLRIADRFDVFLADYAAAGCFRSHAFETHRAFAEDVLTRPMRPSRNRWLRAYRKAFPDSFSTVT